MELTLEGNSKVNLTIPKQDGGGWSYFRNVNLSEKRNLKTPMLGRDLLVCNQLKDPNDNSDFSYVFSIFR
ncbi:hypothetical protein OVS_01740 [Mycoplasma ovis str. Michigan]|uniref:Uncharacterized protein n=1 Tax=Mycoplasma ovis str. Michigan TaxID=1415773 RepID=A0ABM5P1P7_9MOLU|nr:hypothetical protein OVS_01740 [Mycoplasma ovis str. Michigan]